LRDASQLHKNRPDRSLSRAPLQAAVGDGGRGAGSVRECSPKLHPSPALPNTVLSTGRRNASGYHRGADRDKIKFAMAVPRTGSTSEPKWSECFNSQPDPRSPYARPSRLQAQRISVHNKEMKRRHSMSHCSVVNHIGGPETQQPHGACIILQRVRLCTTHHLVRAAVCHHRRYTTLLHQRLF
jgi:hypothetical protein